MTALVPVLGSTLGKIFQPLFQALAWLIAFFYAMVPNYAVAIALLTLVVMIVTAPLSVKSTRSMVAMQRLSPELKKLQQKYKGDRQKLNEEMMNLYKEHGVNPAGGCLPMIIQLPVFLILYDVIRGLTNTVKRGKLVASLHHVCAQAVCPDPRYISTNTKLYQDLAHADGKMPAFGIDLAQQVFGHHPSFAATLPYIALVLVAIALQYLQMRQLNTRNQAMAQANPQAQMMQRYMPIFFAVIYLNISAGVNVYFIVSALCRIGIQEGVFRSGITERAAAGETKLPGRPGAPKRKTLMERLAEAQQRAIEAQQARQAALQAGPAPAPAPAGRDRPPSTAGGKPPRSSNGRGPDRQPKAKGAGGASGDSASGGTTAGASGGTAGSGPASNGGQDKGQQPRSKVKRTRKGR